MTCTTTPSSLSLQSTGTLLRRASGGLSVGVQDRNFVSYSTWGTIPSDGSLSTAEFKDAYNSTAFGNVLGLVLNTHVSVTWSTVGIFDEGAVAYATDMLLGALEAVCVDNGVPSAWISVLENGRVRGLHLHLLGSFPMNVGGGLKAWIEAEVRKISGVCPLVCTVSETVSVKVNSDRNINIQWSLFRYFMKSVHPDAALDAAPLARVFGLLLKSQGPVFGPRLRVAKTLSREARERRVFKSLLDEGCRDYGQIFSEIYLRDGKAFCADSRPRWNLAT